MQSESSADHLLNIIDPSLPGRLVASVSCLIQDGKATFE